MQHLVLEETPVESERDVVTNERRERVEDDVDGWLDEQLMAHAFTVHPYRWPTIGWMEDIRALSLPDIRAFYRTWYAPNNATIVCVGDFDEAALLDLIAQHYGAHPARRRCPSRRRAIVEPEQTRERIVRAPKPIATDRLLDRLQGARARTRPTGPRSRSSRPCSPAVRRRGCIAGW